MLLQARLDLAVVDERQQQVHPERAGGELTGALDLGPDQRSGQATHAEDPEAAGVGHGGGQFRAGAASPHAGVPDRQINAKALTERGLQHRGSLRELSCRGRRLGIRQGRFVIRR